jgi:predicted regulator of Ras-like GTPase activity (Roadblock/LC7/MglB family)
MIKKIPKGTTIGTMQAPLSWIFSHTSRFVGIVRITIQDGKGVILIDKGKARLFYFEHGQRILRGNAAREYFNTQPLLNFTLDKLTGAEFETALAITGADIPAGINPPEKDVPGRPETQSRAPVPPGIPVPAYQKSSGKMDPPEGMKQPVKPEKQVPPGAEVQADPVSQDTEKIRETGKPVFKGPGRNGAVVPTFSSQTLPASVQQNPELQKTIARIMQKAMTVPETQPEKDSLPVQSYEKVPPASSIHGDTAPQPQPQQPEPWPAPPVWETPQHTSQSGILPDDYYPETDFQEIARILLGRIKAVHGVIAVMVFNKDTHLISIGDVNLDKLVSSAEDMLMTVNQLDSVMQWGSFVQMTIQVPTGNVIVSPFFDEYLCILTSPEINLGRIRRILREIKAQDPC